MNDQQPHWSPRQRQHHRDNSCHDNSCHGDNSGRPVPQGGLIRSRSDETLNNNNNDNVSLIVGDRRRRRSSTVRRRHKKTTTTTTTTDRLITEFNEGKEIDLDRLTTARGICNDLARPSNSQRLEIDFNEGKEIDLDRLTSLQDIHTRTCNDMQATSSQRVEIDLDKLPPARDICTRACNDSAVPTSSHRLEIDFNEGREVDLDKLTTAHRSNATRTCDDLAGSRASSRRLETHANVCNWLRTQNNIDGAVSSRPLRTQNNIDGAASSRPMTTATRPASIRCSKQHSVDVHHL